MSVLFGGAAARANNTTTSLGAPAALTIQTSIQGKPRAIGWGTGMIAGNLIDLTDFTPYVVANYTSNPATSAGKGFGRSAQSSQPTYSYVYYANVLIGLAEGPIANVISFSGDGMNQSTFGDGDAGGYNFWGDQTQLPFSTFETLHPDRALAYRGLAYIAYAPMYLGANTNIPNFQYEVIFASYTGMGSDFPLDANPADINYDFLTNIYYGVPGWDGSMVGDRTSYRNFCQAMGLAMSPILADQTEAASFLSSIMQATYAEFCWSNAQLQMIPYGEVPVTAHGATYTPNTTPVYFLAISDFQPLQGGSSAIPGTPVGFRRKASDEIINNVKIEWLDRSQIYSPAEIDHKDEASIVSSFERPSDVRQNHFFKLKDAAAMSASLQLLREQVVGTYYFTLNKTFILLDLMDLVTLPLDEFGITEEPVTVRIKEIQENSDYTLSFTCEEFFGATTAPLYTRQGALHDVPDFNVDPGVINPPVIFEVPQAADKTGMLNIYAAVSGVDTNHFGGCDVYVSYDDATYIRVDKMLGASRMGVTTGAISAIGNSTTHDYVDIGSTLNVNLNESHGVLSPGSGADMLARNTLCWLEGELISFSTINLTSAYNYSITPLLRGAYGTNIAAHGIGSRFVRVDGLVAKVPYEQARTGTFLYLKFVPFNVYGGGQKTLADATAYTYRVNGTAAYPDSTLPDTFLDDAANRDFVQAVASANFDRANAAAAANAKAGVTSNAQSIVNLTGAFASYQQEVFANFGSSAADVKINADAISNLTGAFADYQVSVSASFDSTNASVTTNSTAIAGINGNLSASWSVTVDVNSKISGIKLYGTSTTSTFDIRADSFNIYAVGYSVVPVFSVSTIGGVAGITIDGTKLADISVLNQAITNNAVSNGSASTGRTGGSNTSGTASLTARGGARIVILATYNGGTHVTGVSSFRAGLLDITYTPPGGSAVTKSFVIPNFWSGTTLQTLDNMTCTAAIQLAGVGVGTWSAFAHSYLPTIGDYTDVDTTITIQEFSK